MLRTPPASRALALAFVCLWAPSVPASAQATTALVSQFRGEVKVLKAPEGTELPIKVGLRLVERDRVDVARGSRVVLLFNNGRLVTATTALTIAPVGGEGSAEVYARAERTLAAAGQVRRPEAKSGVGRPPPAGAYPLAPAFGSAVASERPTFAWQPREGAEAYLLQIRPVAGGAPLRFQVAGAGPWTLPDSVAPLARGAEYAWTVVPVPGGRLAGEERFRVLDGAGLADLEALHASLAEAGVDPGSDGLLLVAMLSADLGLLHDALAALEGLVAGTPEDERDPVVDLLHAEVLEKLGRTDEARAAYDRAQRPGG
ncbi:MAG TPA: hypothetical protein VLH75_12610 [Longimicrobiales bacterium]|nr:hypothetical protein [Longimicrobiales bacterium]